MHETRRGLRLLSTMGAAGGLETATTNYVSNGFLNSVSRGSYQFHTPCIDLLNATFKKASK